MTALEDFVTGEVLMGRPGYGAGLRLTSTMPAATSTRAASRLGVTDSLSQSEPNTNAKIGVRNTNTDSLVAG